MRACGHARTRACAHAQAVSERWWALRWLEQRLGSAPDGRLSMRAVVIRVGGDVQVHAYVHVCALACLRACVRACGMPIKWLMGWGSWTEQQWMRNTARLSRWVHYS